MSDDVKLLLPRINMYYEPHNEGQRAFHESRYVNRFRAILTGTGGGKTYAGSWEALQWVIYNEGITGLIYEPNTKMLHRNLIPTLADFLRPKPKLPNSCPYCKHKNAYYKEYPKCMYCFKAYRPKAKAPPIEESIIVKNYHKSIHKIEFINSSVLWLGSLHEPGAVEGINADFIMIDEAAEVAKLEEAWNACQRRIRGSGGGHPLGMWVTTVPTCVGSFLWELFAGPDENRLPNSAVFSWATKDNPHLDKTYVESISKLHKGYEYQIYSLGQWGDVGRGTYPFAYSKHVLMELPEDVTINKYIYGVDFGWRVPTAIVVLGISDEDIIYVLDEWYEKEMSEEQIYRVLDDFFQKYDEGPIYCDKAEPRVIDYLSRKNMYAIKNNTGRDEGIRAVGQRMLYNDEEGIVPELYFLRKCNNLIQEIRDYDQDIKENDHACDALRYAMANYIILLDELIIAV